MFPGSDHAARPPAHPDTVIRISEDPHDPPPPYQAHTTVPISQVSQRSYNVPIGWSRETQTSPDLDDDTAPLLGRTSASSRSSAPQPTCLATAIRTLYNVFSTIGTVALTLGSSVSGWVGAEHSHGPFVAAGSVMSTWAINGDGWADAKAAKPQTSMETSSWFSNCTAGTKLLCAALTAVPPAILASEGAAELFGKAQWIQLCFAVMNGIVSTAVNFQSLSSIWPNTQDFFKNFFYSQFKSLMGDGSLWSKGSNLLLLALGVIVLSYGIYSAVGAMMARGFSTFLLLDAFFKDHIESNQTSWIVTLAAFFGCNATGLTMFVSSLFKLFNNIYKKIQRYNSQYATIGEDDKSASWTSIILAFVFTVTCGAFGYMNYSGLAERAFLSETFIGTLLQKYYLGSKDLCVGFASSLQTVNLVGRTMHFANRIEDIKDSDFMKTAREWMSEATSCLKCHPLEEVVTIS